MTVYHQMGNNSKNLLTVDALSSYRGAIVSPTDMTVPQTRAVVEQYRSHNNFETIFDPQLYFPHTDRKIIHEWSYFPKNYATIDVSDSWFEQLNQDLATVMGQLQPDAICSPVIIPKKFTLDFYDQTVKTAQHLMHIVEKTMPHVEIIQTCVLSLKESTDEHMLNAVASLLTTTPAYRIYLIFHTGDDRLGVRSELRDAQELANAMRFIRILEHNDKQVIVGYSSSDMILWKTAGATSCATGKYWNLRRFTPARWDVKDEDTARTTHAYWFEERLLSSIRKNDLTRLLSIHRVSPHTLNNPFLRLMLDSIAHDKAGIAIGWQQYLHWFASMEARISQGLVNSTDILRDAESEWIALEDDGFYMDERRNNGEWIRSWRQALADFHRLR